MKPIIHAENNVKKWGGKVEDYLPIHQFMDSSKGAMCDVRHRVLTHTSWFIQPDGILEKIFGITITNSDGRVISVRDIGEEHILEDFNGFIPTPQDFLRHMETKPWMHRAGGTPNDDTVYVEGQSNVELKLDINVDDLNEAITKKIKDIVEEVFEKEKKEAPVFPGVPYDPVPYTPNPFRPYGPQEYPYVKDFIVTDAQQELIPYCKSESINIKNHDKEHFVCFSNDGKPNLNGDIFAEDAIKIGETVENYEGTDGKMYRGLNLDNMKLNVSC